MFGSYLHSFTFQAEALVACGSFFEGSLTGVNVLYVRLQPQVIINTVLINAPQVDNLLGAPSHSKTGPSPGGIATNGVFEVGRQSSLSEQHDPDPPRPGISVFSGWR